MLHNNIFKSNKNYISLLEKDPNNKTNNKETINKNKAIIKKELKNFFHWVKGAELVDLKECNISKIR